MLQIERNRHSENGAFNVGCIQEIRAIEDSAHDILIEHLTNTGELVGNGYSQAVVSADEIDRDIIRKIGGGSGRYFVSTTETDFSVYTTIFNLSTHRGIETEVAKGDGFTEQYQLSPENFKRKGSRLLIELFNPGTYPELSELIASTKHRLVDPDELPARIMTEEEQRLINVQTSLGGLSTKNVARVIADYVQVAYPDKPAPSHPTDEPEVILKKLADGRSIGLRLGTRDLDCAKLALSPETAHDRLTVSMYLNYEIPFGPVSLYFREDIAMALGFAKKIRRYLR